MPLHRAVPTSRASSRVLAPTAILGAGLAFVLAGTPLDVLALAGRGVAVAEPPMVDTRAVRVALERRARSRGSITGIGRADDLRLTAFAERVLFSGDQRLLVAPLERREDDDRLAPDA